MRWSYGSPVLALVLTLITTALIFAILGKDPGVALYTFFIKPLTTHDSLSELLVKAAPLILIGTGLVSGISRQCLEHRRRGPIHHGRDWPAAGSAYGSMTATAFC